MQKERKYRGKKPSLSKDDVQVVLSFLAKNDKIEEIAELYNVSVPVIKCVLNGTGAYNYVKGTETYESMKKERKNKSKGKSAELDAETIKKIQNLLNNKYTLMKACRYLKLDYQSTYIQWKKLEGSNEPKLSKIIPLVKTNCVDTANELINLGYQLFNTHTIQDEIIYILKKEDNGKTIKSGKPERGN